MPPDQRRQHEQRGAGHAATAIVRPHRSKPRYFPSASPNENMKTPSSIRAMPAGCADVRRHRGDFREQAHDAAVLMASPSQASPIAATAALRYRWVNPPHSRKRQGNFKEYVMTEFDPATHRMVPAQRWFEDFVLGERFVLPSRTQTRRSSPRSRPRAATPIRYITTSNIAAPAACRICSRTASRP